MRVWDVNNTCYVVGERIKKNNKFKKTLILVAASTILMLTMIVDASASSELKRECDNADGTVVAPGVLITNYIESSQDEVGTRVIFEGGGYYKIDLNATATKQVRDVSRIAYLTGLKVNLCSNTRTTPHTIWIVELTK